MSNNEAHVIKNDPLIMDQYRIEKLPRREKKAAITASFFELKERFDDPTLFDRFIEFIVRIYNK